MAFQQPMWEALCYSTAELRQGSAADVCDEGVIDVGADSLKVTTGGTGLELDIAAGGAWVQGDQDAPDQSYYRVRNDDVETVTASAAHATLPRIDQVVVTVNDSDYGGLNQNAVPSVLAGTATSGATLANLTGAAALPDNTIRLAYVLVPAAFTGPFVNATHILDARVPFASCSGQWQDWAAVWDGASGDPTIDAANSRHRYARVGDTIIVQFEATYSAAGSGTLSLSLPIPPLLPVLNDYSAGFVTFRDAGSGVRDQYDVLIESDGKAYFVVFGGSTEAGAGGSAGDRWTGTFTYEAA